MESADELIPENETGVQTNTESFAEFETEAAAKEFFQTARKRLLNINEWQGYAGAATAEFRLTDSDGNEVQRLPVRGDYFRIRIPGPGTVTGEGFDWVRVEALDENDDEVVIRVRPASSPLNNRKDVAHFFSEDATSNFVCRREKNKVVAAVYGRNEKPNLTTEKVVDTIRNAAVATGAIGGLSKLQWKSLVNGLVKTM